MQTRDRRSRLLDARAAGTPDSDKWNFNNNYLKKIDPKK